MIEIKRHNEFPNAVFIDGELIPHQSILSPIVKKKYIICNIIDLEAKGREYYLSLPYVVTAEKTEELTPHISRFDLLIFKNYGFKKRPFQKLIIDYLVAYYLKAVGIIMLSYWRWKIRNYGK